MKTATKVFLPVVILAAGIASMFLFMGMREDPPPRNETPRPKLVLSQVVTLDQVTTHTTAYGRVVSAHPIELVSEVNGTAELGDVPFQPAQRFAEGDLLLKIDDRQARLRLNSAKSELLTALAAALAEVKSDFPKLHRVWEEFFRQCDFDRRTPELPPTDDERLKLLMARFNVFKLYYAVRDQEIVVDKHYIYAPFDGSILEADLRVGAAARNGSRLGSIISTDDLEVQISLPAAELESIDRKSTVSLTSSETSERWQGTIARVGSHVDTRTQTVDLFVRVDPSGVRSLLNGVFLQARLAGRPIERSVSLPRSALYDDSCVYRVIDGKLDQQVVAVAHWGDDSVVIAGGLNDGDTVVVEALQGVAQGNPASARFERNEGSL